MCIISIFLVGRYYFQFVNDKSSEVSRFPGVTHPEQGGVTGYVCSPLDWMYFLLLRILQVSSKVIHTAYSASLERAPLRV